MKEEAAANSDKDKAEKEKVVNLNLADSLIFQTEKQLKEYGDKIPADKKGVIESALNKLKEAHKSQDLAQIDPAVTELNNAWTAASEELYKATQGAGGPQANADGGQQGGNGAGNAGENVTDAEFEEVK
jgi:molecular chaperone DnaK